MAASEADSFSGGSELSGLGSPGVNWSSSSIIHHSGSPHAEPTPPAHSGPYRSHLHGSLEILPPDGTELWPPAPPWVLHPGGRVVSPPLPGINYSSSEENLREAIDKDACQLWSGDVVYGRYRGEC